MRAAAVSAKEKITASTKLPRLSLPRMSTVKKTKNKNGKKTKISKSKSKFKSKQKPTGQKGQIQGSSKGNKVTIKFLKHISTAIDAITDMDSNKVSKNDLGNTTSSSSSNDKGQNVDDNQGVVSNSFDIPQEWIKQFINIPHYRNLKQNLYRPPLSKPPIDVDEAYVCNCSLDKGGCGPSCENRLLFT
jgi:hypothetical protein